VSTADFKGQALAITFIFTRCPLPNFCPRMSSNFDDAQKKLLSLPSAPTNWHLLTISFDPEFDSPVILNRMLTGTKLIQILEFFDGDIADITAIFRSVRPEFWREEGAINHNLRTVVIDDAGRVQTFFKETPGRRMIGGGAKESNQSAVKGGATSQRASFLLIRSTFACAGGSLIGRGRQSMQKTVLLVEDNTDLLELLVRSLCGRFKIVTATDGLEALRLAGEVSPVLIVLDLMLPEMDGFQVCERLRQSPKTCNVPILIMTGLPGEFPGSPGWIAGARLSLPSPFRLRNSSKR